MQRLSSFILVAAASMLAAHAGAAPTVVTFESAGADAAAITATRDAFRVAVGGGAVAGANGSFGGLRREINWDGVPAGQSDSATLSADFFNTTSPRGVVFSTPGTGFLVSANGGGATPILFGFPNEFQAFSAQKIFTAVNSNTTDVRFFVPGTATAATTSAFGLIFVDVEVANITKLEFFDDHDNLFYTRDALVAGNQGFSFVGGVVSGGSIGRVRIISGANTIVSNGVVGNLIDDVVAMDDFLYAEPLLVQAVPEPSVLALSALGLLSGAGWLRRRRSASRRPASRRPAR